MRKYHPHELKLGQFYKNGPWYYLYIGKQYHKFYTFVEYSITDKQHKIFYNIVVQLEKDRLYFD